MGRPKKIFLGAICPSFQRPFKKALASSGYDGGGAGDRGLSSSVAIFLIRVLDSPDTQCFDYSKLLPKTSAKSAITILKMAKWRNVVVMFVML